MRKLALTLAIILEITIGASAQNRGLFDRGPEPQYEDYSTLREGNGSPLMLPGSHGESNDQGAPLGSGALLLIGFGAAYALKKRNQK